MRSAKAKHSVVVPELEALAGQVVRPWSDADIAVVLAYYGRVPTVKLAQHLGKSAPSVRQKAQSLGAGLKKT